MNIRTYRPGDEAAQTAIYNEAAADLPRFKPASLEEVNRRHRARDFDPDARFFAEVDGRPVGYATFHANGRVNFPWCRTGHEQAAGPLFQRILQAMRDRRLKSAFAAYRSDWTAQKDFFQAHGFELVREMVNFVLDPADMPTRPGRRSNPLTALRREDIPALFEMGANVIRSPTPQELEQHLFKNPYFPPDSLFVLRSRTDDSPLAVGILVTDLTYADPNQVDAAMPCFRLGAFGTEGMQTKRLNGLFSFLSKDQRSVSPLALDLLGHATFQLEEAGGGGSLAAQVPSDVSYLLRFYHSYFRRQGSFPIFERAL